jgi:hypothetical protein
LCETKRDMLNSLINDNDIAKQWIMYVCDRLQRGVCHHYFIESINLLENYSKDYLDRLRKCLMNIDLEKQHLALVGNESMNNKATREYFEAREKLFNNWKIKDVINMIDAYRHLIAQYFPYASDNNLFDTINLLAVCNDGKADRLYKLKEILLSDTDNAKDDDKHLPKISHTLGPDALAFVLLINISGFANSLNNIVCNEESMKQIRYICEKKPLPNQEYIADMLKHFNNQTFFYKRFHEDHLLLSTLTDQGKADKLLLKERTLMGHLPNGPQLASYVMHYGAQTEKIDINEYCRLAFDELYAFLKNLPEESHCLTFNDFL